MNVVPLFPLSRIDELALRELMKRDAHAYLPTLADDRHYPDAVRHLCALLPPHAATLHGILWEGESLAPRVADAFGLLGKKAPGTTPLRKVFELIRDTQGPVGECVRALLTGTGDSPAALLLRRVVEQRRGSALPVVDITSKGGPTPEIAAVIEAEKAHVEMATDTDSEALLRDRDRKRVQRAKLKQQKAAAEVKERERQRKREEQAAKKAAAIAARSARQLERDRESERRAAARSERDRERRKLKTADDVRREICADDPDELSERIDYREQVARGER